MSAMIALGSFFLLYGAANFLFAFREVPAPLRILFPLRLPLIFAVVLLFVSERNAVKVARLCLAGLFVVAGVATFGQLVYSLIFGWA